MGGIVGASVAHALRDHQNVYIGLMSFGVAALLYLVTEELLLEAHCKGLEEHVWYVDLMFFVGFLVSLLVELLTEDDDGFFGTTTTTTTSAVNVLSL